MKWKWDEHRNDNKIKATEIKKRLNKKERRI